MSWDVKGWSKIELSFRIRWIISMKSNCNWKVINNYGKFYD